MEKEPATVTIEITTGHCLGGAGNDVYPGDVLVAPRDLPIKEALRKVRIGYAHLVPDAQGDLAPRPNPPGPGVMENRDPVVASRDPIAAPLRRHMRVVAGTKSPHKGRS